MAHDVDFYLKHGFEERAARYFAAGRRRPVSVRPLPNQKLSLTFDDGEQRVFDVSPLIEPGCVFDFLADEQAFSQVYIDSEGAIAWDRDPTVDSNVVWSNKVDIDPDTCYMDSVAP